MKKFLDEDNDKKLELNKKIDELIKIERENSSNMRKIYKAIENSNDTISSAISDLKIELLRISTQMLKTMQEKMKLKENKQLDLDLNFRKQKSDIFIVTIYLFL